jgi:hypothetical protein
LDDYNTVGVYSVVNASQPSTVLNLPESGISGRFFVVASGGVVYQQFFTYGINYKIYARSFTDTSKNVEWRRLDNV